MRTTASCFVLALFCIFGCLTDGGVNDGGSGGSRGYGGDGGYGATIGPTGGYRPYSSTTSGEDDKEKDEDRGPCPTVEYYLWEENGIVYTVEIKVFCDPIKDLNLGCPEPF